MGLIVEPEITPFMGSAGRGYLSLEWNKMSFRFLALLWPTITLLLLTKAKFPKYSISCTYLTPKLHEFHAKRLRVESHILIPK